MLRRNNIRAGKHFACVRAKKRLCVPGRQLCAASLYVCAQLTVSSSQASLLRTAECECSYSVYTHDLYAQMTVFANEALVGEERDVAEMVVKTEKDPLSVLTLVCKVGGPRAQRGGGSCDSKRGLEVTEYTAYVASLTKTTSTTLCVLQDNVHVQQSFHKQQLSMGPSNEPGSTDCCARTALHRLRHAHCRARTVMCTPRCTNPDRKLHASVCVLG